MSKELDLGKRSPENELENSSSKKLKSENDITQTPWLTKSIVVKVLDKELGNGEYYK